MISTSRCFILVVLLSASVPALADWDGAKYVRVNADRVVVFAHKQTFDLTRDAAWDVADPKAKKAFDAWVGKMGLPKDPGLFVQDLPKEREATLQGEIKIGPPTKGITSLSLTSAQDANVADVVQISGDGNSLKLVDPFRKIFGQWSKKQFGLSSSSMLVALANTSGTVSEEQAWAKILQRSSQGDFFEIIGGKKAIWVHTTQVAAPVIPAVTQPPKSPVAPSTPKKESSDSTIPIIGGIVGVLVLGGGLAFVFRSRIAGAGRTKELPFPVGAHERELIMKVREEGQKNPPPANKPYSVEEYAVGRVLERYSEFDRLQAERDRFKAQAEALASYKEFKEAHDAHMAKLKTALDALKLRDSELAKEQKARADLQETVNQAERYVKHLQDEQDELTQMLQQSECLVKEIGDWSRTVVERLNAQAAKIHHE
jgi:hypothetical protein